jgi:acyl carrier protein
MEDKMEDAIKELFSTLINVPAAELTQETTPDSLEPWDSMQHLILVSGFEEEFNIEIEPEDTVEMYNDYGTFERIVKSKLK